MLFSKLEGMEVIDKNGERVGLVKDIDFDTKGKIKFIITTPAGILGKVVNLEIKIPFKLVTSIGDVIYVDATLDELKKA